MIRHHFKPSLIGEVDLHLFGRGVHYEIYRILGARRFQIDGLWGVHFAVWAPSAKKVSVVGDFNGWRPDQHPMHANGDSGVWSLFIPGLDLGEKYKFYITSQEGKHFYKTDPYSYRFELRPNTASIVAAVDRFAWSDEEWLQNRLKGVMKPHPINIYEVHAGSWKRPHGRVLNYRELGIELGAYCKTMGYTHVEFMPLQEHPLDDSWGYQVTGYYAVTSRFGTVEDFQWMVNHFHEIGIGVILDWVPGHFPQDEFSLARFDGTALYEHEDPRQGIHPHWDTCIFNFSRKETSNFLIANALFWVEKMHVDGLRVDAVASMLYLDYGREPGNWIPNIHGGNENLEAIEFLKHLNQVMHERNPGVLMIAEDSTAFSKVTRPPSEGGLGFDMKWNMGWMNDTLHYFAKDPLFRRYDHKDVTFGLVYAFSENFTLALSHDEVVHGKKHLLSKMPGDVWQQFAHLRLLLSYQICHSGKKLIFMGSEFGQWKEWAFNGQLDWNLLSYPVHGGIQTCARELNFFYLQHRALWERDFTSDGFSWVDFSDLDNGVISYLRKSGQEELLCVHHFTPTCVDGYRLRMPNLKKAEEIFNTDAEKYGGSGKLNRSVTVDKGEMIFTLAPLATQVFSVEWK